MMNESYTNKDFKVLIVDDVTRNIQVVGSILRKSNYNVAYAQNGERAIELALENDYDLILLDVMMPEMNGFEVCEKLKADEKTKHIPVIFLTAKTDSESILKGFELGGVDYITKPFNSTEMLARVKTHLSLKRTQEELRESNKAKDKFFSILAHDLKNPLGTFRNVTQVLNENYNFLGEDDRKQLIETISQTSSMLYELLENLLNWSRTQTGGIQFNPSELNLAWAVNNNIDLIKSTAANKSIEIVSKVPKDTFVYADTNMVNTVFRNLLTNAIKFTPEKGVVTISTSNHQDNYLRVSIKDTGIGIDENDLDKLFRIDVHHSSFGTHQESGTGLGLILCKEFILKHGGDIWVESIAGNGSVFHFTLPKKASVTI